MLILGIDTSTQNTSVGLAKDGKSVGVRSVFGKSVASEKLLSLIDELFQTDYSFTDVDAIAVNIGPGSYTGLRIGLATAKGLALPKNLPVLPVPTFSALNYIVRQEWNEDVVLFMHSHQEFVYYCTSAAGSTQFPISHDTFQNVVGLFPDVSIFIGDSEFSMPEGKQLFLRYPQGDHVAQLAFHNYDDLVQKCSPELEPEYHSNLEVVSWTRKSR